jgi:dienelactone hydrolase
VHWSTEVTNGGVRQRRFDLDRGGRHVPGLLWTPEGARGPRPLVLIGHGAGGSKLEGYVVSLARRLVRHYAFAAAAIDGPVHGDRREDGGGDGTLAFLEFSQAWSLDPDMTDDMVADWRATLDALQGLDDVGPGPVGWWGLSMGTIIGLPVVAAEPRITVAVLGLMGLTGPTRDRIAADAPAVTCPVLFLVQLEDELFARPPSLALFDALGSRDKRLHANPGRHAAVPPEEFGESERFLARHLRS